MYHKAIHDYKIPKLLLTTSLLMSISMVTHRLPDEKSQAPFYSFGFKKGSYSVFITSVNLPRVRADHRIYNKSTLRVLLVKSREQGVCVHDCLEEMWGELVGSGCPS